MEDVCAVVVSLQRATRRRETVSAELAAAGVPFVFQDAFDISTTPHEFFLERCRRNGRWGVFAIRDMACTLSHAEVWKRFLAGPGRICLVLEDDIFVAPDLGAWMRDLSWWPDGADIVKIERWRARSMRVLLARRGRSHRGRELRRMWTRHSGSAGYFMTRDAAARLLAAQPYDVPVDHLLFNFNASHFARAAQVWQVQPALVQQGNDPGNEQSIVPRRERTVGLTRLRQESRRAYLELAYPLTTWLQLVTGRSRLEAVRFSRQAGTAAQHQSPQTPRKDL